MSSGNPSSSAPGTLFTVSAPSGAGKTSLVKTLVERDDNLQVSVSHTTRKMRHGEEDGVNYHFVDDATFSVMVADEAFLEHAKVFDNSYGTSKQWVLDSLQRGIDVILEIDWQGAASIKAWAASQAAVEHAGIFILPPSIDALRARLIGRGQDDDEVIARRMADAVEEISHHGDADYLVVNDDFELAVEQLQAIVESSRLRMNCQTARHHALLASLNSGK